MVVDEGRLYGYGYGYGAGTANREKIEAMGGDSHPKISDDDIAIWVFSPVKYILRSVL